MMELIISTNLNNGGNKRKIIIPQGYRELLRDMTVDVLRNQPPDMIDYCIKWLSNKKSGGASIPTASKEPEKVSLPSETLSPKSSDEKPPLQITTSRESQEKKKFGLTMKKTSSAPAEEEHHLIHVEVMSPEKAFLESKLFSNVDPNDLKSLVGELETINVEQGHEILFNDDDDPDKIYFILTGRYDLFADFPKVKVRLAELNHIGYFGDTKGLLRCHAKTPGKMVAIKRSLISQEIFDKINEKREEYGEFVEDMELFEKLTDFERRLIVDSFVVKEFGSDQEIVKEGETGEEMYLLFEGFGCVIQDGKEINTVAEGGFFGEMALTDNEPRCATIKSTSDVKVLTIGMSIFKGIIEPRCREYLDKVIKNYLKDPNEEEEEDDSDMDTPPFEKVNMPRKSVSAGKFNPEMLEEDDEEEIQEELAKEELQKTEEQMEKLRECCKKILLFRCLDDEQMDVVIGVMFPKPVAPGDEIIKYGEDGDNFYIIESGIYDIKVPIKGVETKVAQFDNQGSFGELALMYNTPRSATVIAASEGQLWALTREMFRKIVLKKAFQKRIMYENLIGQVPLLKELSGYEKMSIADALRTRIYDAGTHIINQGDEGIEMFFIEEGRIEIFVDFQDGMNPEIIGELERGKYFGEMALITHKPRAASAVAKTKCKLAVLDRESFERLLGPCVDVMKRNMEDYQNSVANRKSMASAVQLNDDDEE